MTREDSHPRILACGNPCFLFSMAEGSLIPFRGLIFRSGGEDACLLSGYHTFLISNEGGWDSCAVLVFIYSIDF